MIFFVVALLILAVISVGSLIFIEEMEERRNQKQLKTRIHQGRFILWVTVKQPNNEGYSSRWYGWSKNLILGYDEALKERDRIIDRFYDVEIVDLDYASISYDDMAHWSDRD